MIKVFLLSYEKNLNQEEYEFFYKLVDKDRRTKADRLRKQADKERCILAGGLLQYVLKREKTGDNSLEVLVDKNGKPYVNGGPEFSLSHAGKWIGLAVSDKPAGLDIEGGREFQDRAAAKFSPEEQSWYKALEAREKEEGFYRIWTGKEAYSKRDGRGMGMDFSGFSIFAKDVAGDLFYQQIGNNYYISVCTEENWDGKVSYLSISDLKNQLENQSKIN